MIELYDASSIDRFVWPQEESDAQRLLVPLIKEGASSFIANVKTKVYLLGKESYFIPLTVNEKEYDNAYVASNYCALAIWQNTMKRTALKNTFFHMASGVFKLLDVNKVVFLNNYLLTTNLAPRIPPQILEEMLQFLQKRFSGYLLMWRNLIDGWDHEKEVLCNSGFQLMKTREVYIYDVKQKASLSSKVHYHHRRDFRLIEEHDYEVITRQDIQPEDTARILSLYHQVYVDKHTNYSPIYTKKFLESAIREGFFDFIGLCKGGQIDGIAALFVKGEWMSCPFFGYDTTSPLATALYRMMSILLLREAERRKVSLNDGSGGASTKQFKGLRPHTEFLALYGGHLPWPKRLFWSSTTKLLRL